MKKLFLVLLLSSRAFATDYFIKIGGNDLSDGLSIGTAWATINKANLSAGANSTVYILSGTYTNGIVFPANGITYSRYSDTSTVYVNVGTSGIVADFSSRSNCTLYGIRGYNVYNFFYASGTTSGNTVQNCRFYNARGFIACFIEGTSATGWKILYNYIDKADTIGGDSEDAINIQANTSTGNLIRGNYIARASHSGVQMEASPNVGDNIVDSNYVYLCHNGIDVASPRNLIQRNFFFNANSALEAAGDAMGTKQGYGDDNIFRYNTIIDTGVTSNNKDGNGYREIVGFGTTVGAVGGAQTGVRFYNNSLYLNPAETVPKQPFWVSTDGTTVVADTIGDFKATNNVIHSMGGDGTSPTMKFTEEERSYSLWGWSFAGNMIHNENTTGIVRIRDDGSHTEDTLTMAEWKSAWGGRVASSNTDTDPVYTSESSPWNLSPPEGAPQIDAGVALTTVTTTTGSGTSITLADGRYFFGPVSGIYSGDSIKIASQDPVGISTISRSAGTVTLSSSRSWTQGDPVYYWSASGTPDGKPTLVGSYPDIGAYEYQTEEEAPAVFKMLRGKRLR